MPDKMVRTTTQSSSSKMAPEEKHTNGTVTFFRKIYRPLGFNKGYNFPLFVIFAGAMMGFTLARLPYLNITGAAQSSYVNNAPPGQWYWYKNGIYRVGFALHIGAILPAGFLMVFQFVPVIRHKFLLFHRINGHVIILLVFVANVGALMICRRAFGGSVDTQAGVGVLVILTTTSICLAYYNIKRLQIDQHRAWMLRAMFYLGSIITLRLILIISALVISKVNSYYTTMSCEEIAFIYDSTETMADLYPQCGNANATTNDHVPINANLFSGEPEKIGASLNMSFGMALWVAIILHLVGVEIYLGLTPKESNRLRQVSYERQMEKGLRNPGSSGLTSDRWGDADAWRPSKDVGGA